MKRGSLLYLLLLAGCGGAGTAPVRAYDGSADLAAAELAAVLAGRTGLRVAVLPAVAEGEAAKAVGDLLTEEVTSSLARRPELVLVDRANLSQVLGEMALQQSGVVRESDEIEVGKVAGAQVLVVTRAALVGEQVNVSMRLVEVESGTALGASSLALAYDDRLKTLLADRAARQNVRSSSEVLAALAQIRRGALAEAEAVFEPLSKEQGERRSVGLMGLAAVAAGRGQGARALELCELSAKASSAPSYCWVIEGKLAYERGELPRARELLGRALAAEGSLLAWQRSEAANLMGLVQVAAGEPENALAFYDQAVSLDPNNGEAVGNKARMLEERGDLAAAVALYQRGLAATPDDKVLALLLRDAEMRLAFAQDSAQQKKLQSLAAEMVSRRAAPKKPKDDWTSGRLTMTLLPWEEKGMPATRLGETSFLESSVRSSVESLPNVEVVDRELLSHVLGELELTGSALADNRTALEVGRIVSARLLVGGSIVRMEGEAQVTVKLIETETTRILGAVSEIFPGGTAIGELSHRVGDKLVKKLREAFPLRGRVVQAGADRVEINVGSSAGAAVGEHFAILAVSGPTLLAEGRAVEVSPESTWLELTKKGQIPKGARVERR